MFEEVVSFAERCLRRLGYYLTPSVVKDINLDLTDESQKRVLISYLSLKGVDLTKVTHAAYLHYIQILHYFISRGYCIDTCFCLDEKAISYLKNRRYDVIFGFGKAFEAFCSKTNIPNRILFIMENNPEVVCTKYRERIAYFKTRHPKLQTRKDHKRNEYFNKDIFSYAQKCLHMSSLFNAQSLIPYFDEVKTINANAIFNNIYEFKDEEVLTWIPSSKKNFLWFGSRGFIHKGVDLLLDTFRELPDFHIDFFGLDDKEKSLFHKLRTDNSTDCGHVNVQSVDFINNVVKKHCFLIFPSCSEGMSTSVCTCMAHGIIPIVTQESGLNPHPSIIELEGYRVEYLKNVIVKVSSLPNEKILEMRHLAYVYSRENFSLKHFDDQFSNIMDEMLTNS